MTMNDKKGIQVMKFIASDCSILASVDVVRRAFQSMRGNKLTNNCGLSSTSSLTSSASLGCSGNESDEDLQDLTAQVRKFNVRTFILVYGLVR